MEHRTKAHSGVLATVIAVLAIAVLITFPYAFNLTWSLPGAESDRTLTYSTGKLTWDSAADIDANGVIRLSMFRSDYDGVSAGNGDNVIAPGTEKTTRVRLLNAAGNSVRYSAVLYRLDGTDVPIQAGLSGADPAVADYALPAGVTKDQVVGAVGGALSGATVKTVDVDWNWDYSIDAPADDHDTRLGNHTSADAVQYGLYVVVEDGGKNGGFVLPQTGDNSHLMLWFIVLVVALCLMISLAVWNRRNARRDHEH